MPGFYRNLGDAFIGWADISKGAGKDKWQNQTLHFL